MTGFSTSAPRAARETHQLWVFRDTLGFEVPINTVIGEAGFKDVKEGGGSLGKKEAQQFTSLRNAFGEMVPLRTCLQRNVNPCVEASFCPGFSLTSVRAVLLQWECVASQV